MRTLGWIALAYAAGTIPSAWIVARLSGHHDAVARMRRAESQGDAHYLLWHAGRTAGVVAIVLDVVKGFAPALAASIAGAGSGTLAFMGTAAVLGHSFPPYLRHTAGRGLSAAAGVALALIPRAMVGTGVIALGGTIARRGGQGTSIGFVLLPVLAWLFGYDGALVAMAGAIAVVIALRRLDGYGAERAAGAPAARTLARRLFFDLPARAEP
ncbi:MAG TPA: glycerol-3-phosphate acyltransferase [Actinomycetota bacterium]